MNISCSIIYIGMNSKGYKEYRNKKDNSVLILIPAGEFLMGTSDMDIEQLLQDYPDQKKNFEPEMPQHKVYLKDYYIGKYQITNDQFLKFVNKSGYAPKGNWHDYAKSGREMHPVVDVTWDDAAAYCKWASLRLPKEAEWEKAAGGCNGWKYPWGNEWDKNLCNNLTTNRIDLVASRTLGVDCQTIPVGIIPEGASPFGVMDMAGNVWEFCEGWFKAYPGSSYSGKCLEKKFRIARGGSWHGCDPIPFRCASRLNRPTDEWSPYAGFRLGADIERPS